MSLKTENITLAYGDLTILEDLNVTIPKNKVTVLVGSNGCGKSTLLKSIARLLKPKHGKIFLNEENILKANSKEVAKELAILTQSPSAPDELTIFNLVKQGRYPYQSFMHQWSKKDEEAVLNALNITGVLDIKDKKISELSGGQLQRAWIALTLAQDTDYILLDEPTNHLDMKYKIEILDLLRNLNKDKGRTIVIVLHDINLACRYADHIIALKNGNVLLEGNPEEVVTKDFVHNVFDMKSSVVSCPVFGTPWVIPY